MYEGLMLVNEEIKTLIINVTIVILQFTVNFKKYDTLF